MFFEDFEVGREFVSRERVVTPSDIDLFATWTWAANPLFLSDGFAKDRGFPQRIAPGALVIAFAIGLLYQTGAFDNIVALASIDKMSFRSPTHPGDVIKAVARVVEKRESRSPDRGLVKLDVTCQNVTRGTPAFTAEMLFVVFRKT
ncbi:MAG: MaoC/PaaZ C-terminal domain-containing protein [Candidatus Caldarchaeum sp.]